MTTTEALHKEVLELVDKADDKSLRIVKAILKIEQEKEAEEGDWWDELPVQIQSLVEMSIKDSEEGKGIPHEEMMAQYKNLFKR